MAWVSLMHPFGSVALLERTPYFDVGSNGKGGAQPTWLAVCVDPCWRPYVGRFVVVRERRPGSFFVFAVDQPHVLYSENSDDVPTFAFEQWYNELERAGLVDVWERQREAELAVQSAPVVEVRPARPWSCRLHSVRFGAATVDVNAGGMIVNATGQYQAYVGMEFYSFIRGMKQNDSTTKYRRLDQGDE
jgi:hypothetical protein